MTDNKMDMALDDIIKTTKPQRGRGRGRGRGGNIRGVQRGSVLKRGSFRGRGSQVYTRGTMQRRGRSQYSVQQVGGGGGGLVKLNISNLDFGVSDDDIKELFWEFGDLRRAAIHYDKSGRSLGIAEVVYTSRNSATKALNKYNGVPLDGRKMIIKIAGDQAQQQSKGVDFQARLGNVRGASGNRGGRGRGRGVKRGGARGKVPMNVTKEQLDTEMDDYNDKVE